jgi:IPT/TIG domain
MSTCLVRASKPFRIVFVLVLTSLFSGWTCTAIFGFNSCPDVILQPEIVSLWPDTISADADSVDLTVEGSGFVSQSEILWNGNPLPTTFMDSSHLQAKITQPTLNSLGALAGTTVMISVSSHTLNFVVGCPGWSSGTLVLVIN